MSPVRGAETTPPYRVATELGLAFGYERSFRMSEGSLLWERYLLGIDTATLSGETLARILAALDFPAQFRGAFAAALPDANLLLLGHEQGERHAVFKVYLEFWDKIRAEVLRDPADLSPRPMFLGFKWDPRERDSARVTRYDCFPRLPLEAILARIAALLSGGATGAALETIEQLVRLAAQRGPAAAFKYLEASEEDSVRRSFDLNLYSAELRLHEIFPLVAGLGRHYRIDPAVLAEKCARVGDGIFGHISAGLDRHGKDFFTLYYEPAQVA